MKTHRDIITSNGGTAKVSRAINFPYDTVHQWKRNDSIPAPHWQRIADAGLATLEELAQAAAERVLP